MSFVKIWVHSVWGTKNHERILEKEIRPKLFQHIKQNAKEKNIYVDFVNGYFDHVHCLLTLNTDLSVSKALQLIKGESAFWANREKLTRTKLEWADEYFAVSVSESMIEKVRKYIKNQEEHHKLENFSQEYEKFIKKYGFVSQG
jgi:putative transposase